MRAVGAEARAAAAEPALVGCWVSPGWRRGLGVLGPSDWLDTDGVEAGSEGLVTVLVARRHLAPQRVTVCGYLLDVYCLGVKDALGPRTMEEFELNRFRETYVRAYRAPSLCAPIDLARELLFGVDDFAHALGFEPAPAVARASPQLGHPGHSGAITFGKNGRPFYIQGPFDDARRVLRTLTAATDEGEYDVLIGLDSGSPARRGLVGAAHR